MPEFSQIPAKMKAALLLVAGLAIGAWHSHGIAAGTRPASPQSRLMLETLILLTMVWTLIWTLRRRKHKSHDD